MRIRLATLALLGLGACARTPAPLPAAHYVVGAPYQAAGVWHYPREQFDYDDTGSRSLMPGRAGRTADGEAVRRGRAGRGACRRCNCLRLRE